MAELLMRTCACSPAPHSAIDAYISGWGMPLGLESMGTCQACCPRMGPGINQPHGSSFSLSPLPLDWPSGGDHRLSHPFPLGGLDPEEKGHPMDITEAPQKAPSS